MSMLAIVHYTTPGIKEGYQGYFTLIIYFNLTLVQEDYSRKISRNIKVPEILLVQPNTSFRYLTMVGVCKDP